MSDILLIFMLINSYLMIKMRHPLTCGLILMAQTILTTLLIGTINLNFWYSYILFLIMIGGMLVLFIYMTSIASNEKFSYKNFSTFFLSFILTPWILDFYFFNLNWKENYLMENLNFKISLMKYMNWPTNMILILMIIYLFITLIATVKITNITYGPLRQKF